MDKSTTTTEKAGASQQNHSSLLAQRESVGANTPSVQATTEPNIWSADNRAEKTAPTLEINLHRLSGDEVGYEASTLVLRDARGYFCEQGATAEEAMQNLADAICGNNPSSDASVTRRAFKIVHDERPKIAQKTLLFEISTRGYPLYEDERIIGYNEITTSYQAVPEVEVEAFLETYADRQEDLSVKCICNDLPMPFAAAPELLEAMRLVMAEWDSDPHSTQCFDKAIISKARSAIDKAQGLSPDVAASTRK